jgi:hypothetical protein
MLAHRNGIVAVEHPFQSNAAFDLPNSSKKRNAIAGVEDIQTGPLNEHNQSFRISAARDR